MILECIAKLKHAQICIGNHDDSFISMSVERQGKFVNLAGSITAVADDKDVLYNGQVISRTIHVNCEIFISSKETPTNRCKECQKYRAKLRAMYHRFKQKQLLLIERSSHVNNRFLSDSEKILKMKECKARLRKTEQQLNKMKQALDKQVKETGLHLDEEVHNELLVIMQQNSAELAKVFPSDSLRHLFWKQQFEAASKSNPKQMKWHPLMIRWCLRLN